jgi:hypothetical protein
MSRPSIYLRGTSVHYQLGEDDSMRTFETVRFSEAYNLAASVWSYFNDRPQDACLVAFPIRPRKAVVLPHLQKPHRLTLLHSFLQQFYLENYVVGFEHHRNDMLDLVVFEYETILRFNQVPFAPFTLPEESHPSFERRALQRVAYLRKRLPIARIVQDTFQILFRDRRFLLQFNSSLLAPLLGRRRVSRVTLPPWLRRAVFYRDNGQCVLCGTDLTGADFLSEAVHYDHILPLATGGSNDPTNFQLLCRPCNLTKRTHPGTSDRYPVFWPAQ